MVPHQPQQVARRTGVRHRQAERIRDQLPAEPLVAGLPAEVEQMRPHEGPQVVRPANPAGGAVPGIGRRPGDVDEVPFAGVERDPPDPHPAIHQRGADAEMRLARRRHPRGPQKLAMQEPRPGRPGDDDIHRPPLAAVKRDAIAGHGRSSRLFRPPVPPPDLHHHAHRRDGTGTSAMQRAKCAPAAAGPKPGPAPLDACRRPR